MSFDEGTAKNSSSSGRTLRWILGIGLAGCLVLLAIKGYEMCFPYGFGQRAYVDAVFLWFSLHTYADEHEGRFPDGGETPEASLCLLYPRYVNASILRGRYLTDSKAKLILDSEKTLVGNQCRWHYVPGLTLNDDSRLALAWEQEPRLGGSRMAVFVGSPSDQRTISASQWPVFLAEQERLLSNRDEVARLGIPPLTAKIKLPSGQVIDRYNGPYTFSHAFKPLPEADRTRQTSVTGGSGSESGGILFPQALRHYRQGNLLQDEGTYTLKLILGPMTSKPVTVKFRDGQCTPNSIVFQMEKTEP